MNKSANHWGFKISSALWLPLSPKIIVVDIVRETIQNRTTKTYKELYIIKTIKNNIVSKLLWRPWGDWFLFFSNDQCVLKEGNLRAKFSLQINGFLLNFFFQTWIVPIHRFFKRLKFSLAFLLTILISLFLNKMSASNIPTKYGIILKYGFQYKSNSAFIVSWDGRWELK